MPVVTFQGTNILLVLEEVATKDWGVDTEAISRLAIMARDDLLEPYMPDGDDSLEPNMPHNDHPLEPCTTDNNDPLEHHTAGDDEEEKSH